MTTTTKLRTITATLLAALSIAVAAAPAQAGSGTLNNGVCWTSSSQHGTFKGKSGSIRITLSCRPRVVGDYVATKYNVRFPGYDGSQPKQFERSDGQGANWFFANPDDVVYVQGCRKRYGLYSTCQRWAALTVPRY